RVAAEQRRPPQLEEAPSAGVVDLRLGVLARRLLGGPAELAPVEQLLVLGALAAVGQHAVRLDEARVERDEHPPRVVLQHVAVTVGVEALRQAVERGLDLVRGRLARHAEQVVIVRPVERAEPVGDPLPELHHGLGRSGALDDTGGAAPRASGAPSTWMRACVRRCVFRSRARTLRIPSESMVKLTSIAASPRGRGGMPSSVSVPSGALSANRRDSPWHTWMITMVWFSRHLANTPPRPPPMR